MTVVVVAVDVAFGAVDCIVVLELPAGEKCVGAVAGVVVQIMPVKQLH